MLRNNEIETVDTAGILNFITCSNGKHKMPGSRAIDPMSSIFFRSLFKPTIFQFSTQILLPNA